MENFKASLDGFFNPKSVAVIGASTHKGKVGNDILLNLTKTFTGKIYPVNINEQIVEGLKAYPSILNIDGLVDLAVIVVPGNFVLKAVEECSQKGCKNIIIISAGFGETGQEGRNLEATILEVARKNQIRIIGPNCLGVISTFLPINASFSASTPLNGNVAFVSQSGALGTAVLDMAEAQKFGIGHFVSMGNKIDVSEIDLMQYFLHDERIKVAMMYLEQINDGRKFMAVAKEITPLKPVIVLKSGKSEKGQQAVSSHTGSFAGSAQAYSTAFKQSGVIEVDGLDDFFDLTKGFSLQPLPKNNKVAIITNAGGPGILLTDLLAQYGLELADLSTSAKDKLKEKLPPAASVKNPIDILGDAKPDRYSLAVETALADTGVDAIIVALTPQKMTEVGKTAEMVGEISKKYGKPVMLCFMGQESIMSHYETFQKYSLPEYDSPMQVVKALSQMYKYSQFKLKSANKLTVPELSAKATKEIKNILSKKTTLTENDIRQILGPLKFPLHRAEMGKTKEEILKIAKKIGYPIALKVVSEAIVHKSDVGGVKVNLKDPKELERAYKEMNQALSKKFSKKVIDGYLAGEMIKGFEIILGVKQDPQFGPLVMVGAGGIYTEILKDISFRIAPFSLNEAREMIGELKINKLFQGARGQKPLDLEAVAKLLVKLGDFAHTFPEIKEIDFNPVMVKEKGQGCTIVDLRFLK